MAASNIKVFIKIRPLIAREKNENANCLWQVSGDSIKSTDKQYEMFFDHIYDETKTTQELFDVLARPIVASAMKGINGTIFAYGQTSSGKTYTMMGDEENPGIIPLTVREIFKNIEEIEDREFLIRVGYIEIYNEKIFDLLSVKKVECSKIHENKETGEVNVSQNEVMTNSVEAILGHYEMGNKLRRTGETNMNERSSRSHTIFRITIESREVGKTSEECTVQVSNLNLVDLAGSERADQTRAEGERLKEGAHINKSLLALGNVIRVLSDDQIGNYINYRDSKLTRILSASLGGNAMTSIICTVTPASLEETFCTLLFAQNAKKIKNKPKVNEVMTDQAIMKRMQREIQELKTQLDSEKSRNSELQNIQKIKEQITTREGHFLHSHNLTTTKIPDNNRRRTWAPSSTSSNIPVASKITQSVIPPIPMFFLEPTSRETLNNDDDEEFRPAEEINLDQTLSPGGRTTAVLSTLIATPRSMKTEKRLEDSPNPMKFETMEAMKQRVKFLEEEFQELNDFKKLENTVGEDHKKLVAKLSYANDHIALLEVKVEDLEWKLKAAASDVLVEKANQDRDKAIKAKEKAENILTSVEYEFESFKTKAKKREEELVASLDEARQESLSNTLREKVKSLEEELQRTETQIFSNGVGEEVENKIAELEKLLEASNVEQEKLKVSLADKKKENSRIMEEYDAASAQLVETLQENEQLQKNLGSLERKVLAMEGILMEAEEIEEVDDEAVQILLNWREFIQKNEEVMADLEGKLKKLSEENFQLKNLPTIEESNIESEGELKDRNDELTFEVMELKSQLEVEATKTLESQKLIESLRGELEIEATKALESQKLVETLKNDLEEMKNQAEAEVLKAVEMQDKLETLRAENEFIFKSLPSIEASKIESDIDLKDKIDLLTMELMETKSKLEVELKNSMEAEEFIKELREKVAEDEEKISELHNQINQLAGGLKEKDEKVKQLEDAMSAQENELSMEIAELKSGLTGILELGNENQRLKEVEKEFKKLLSEKMNQRGEESKKAEEKSKQADENLKKADSKVQEMTHRIHELERNEQNMKKNLEELSVELSKKSEELKELQENFQKSTSANTTEEFESIAQTALVDEVEELKKKLEDSEGRIGALESELKEAEEKKSQSLVKIQELEAKISELREEIEKNCDEISKIQAENQKLQEENQKVCLENEKILEEKQKILEEKEEILQENVEILQEKVKVYKENERILEEKQKILQEKEEIQQENEKNLQEKEKIQQENEKNLQEKEKIQQENQKLLKESQKIEQKFQKTLQDFEKSLEENSKFAEDLRKSHEKISSLESELKQASEVGEKKLLEDDKITSLEREISAKDEKIAQLKKETQQIKSENSRVIEHAGELEADLTSLTTEREKLQEKISELESAAGELEVFKAKFNELQAQMTTKENSIKILEKFIKDKEKEIEELQKTGVDSEQLKEATAKVESLQVELHSITAAKLIRDEECKVLSEKVKELTIAADNLKQLQSEMTKIDAENTNLKSKLHIADEEIEKLQKKLKEKTEECEEVKTRFRRRSSDSDKKMQRLEVEKAELLQKLGATEALKAGIELELQKLKQEITKLTNSSSDNDVKFAILDEKFSQLTEAHQKLQTENKKLKDEIETLNEKIQKQISESFKNNKMIADLRDERDILSRQVEESKKVKQSSPEPRDKRVDELYASQNQQLILEGFKSTPTRTAERNNERKNRRQSVHDERRRLSAWERFTDTEVQTDPVSEICACKDLTQKVKELQIEVRKRDCKLSTMERMAQHNPLKMDVEELKKLLTKEQREHGVTRSNLEGMSRNVMKMEAKIELLSKNQVVKKELAGKIVQTVELSMVSKSDYDLLENKLNEVKRAYRQLQDKFATLEDSISREKENMSSNITMRAIEIENTSLKKKLQEVEDRLSQTQTDDVKGDLKDEFDNLKKKYDMTRKLCNLRNEDITRLKTELTATKSDVEKLLSKYAKLKEVLVIRTSKLNDLREKVGETIPAEEKTVN